jgi:dihydroorotase
LRQVSNSSISDQDYATLGSRIKWNPSVKTENDKNGLLAALLEGKLDIIATDHAPHTLAEKNGHYFQALSGGLLVQHALLALLELMHQGNISLEKIVEKTSHHVAEIYKLKHRGYIREGYFADLVLVDLDSSWMVTPENILYGCKWSPFENQVFKSKILKIFVNGNLVYADGVVNTQCKGQRLRFEKHR